MNLGWKMTFSKIIVGVPRDVPAHFPYQSTTIMHGHDGYNPGVTTCQEIGDFIPANNQSYFGTFRINQFLAGYQRTFGIPAFWTEKRVLSSLPSCKIKMNCFSDKKRTSAPMYKITSNTLVPSISCETQAIWQIFHCGDWAQSPQLIRMISWGPL